MPFSSEEILALLGWDSGQVEPGPPSPHLVLALSSCPPCVSMCVPPSFPLLVQPFCSYPFPRAADMVAPEVSADGFSLPRNLSMGPVPDLAPKILSHFLLSPNLPLVPCFGWVSRSLPPVNLAMVPDVALSTTCLWEPTSQGQITRRTRGGGHPPQ